MDLEIIMLSEVSRTEKDKYHDVTYMWNQKCDTNELIYKTETNTQTQKTQFPWGRGMGKGMMGNFGLADANYYIQNGLKTRSYYIAQEIIFTILQ